MSELKPTDSHEQLLGEFKSDFLERLNDVQEFLTHDHSCLSEHFKKQLNDIFLSLTNVQYTPLVFHWLTILEDLCYLVEILSEEGEDLEEDLFDFWTEGSSADVFLQLNSKLNNVQKATRECLLLLESQILGFYFMHCTSAQEDKISHFSYSPVSELGDFEGRLYLNWPPRYVDLTENEKKSLPILLVSELLPIKNQIKFSGSNSTLNIKSTQDDGLYFTGGDKNFHLLPTKKMNSTDIDKLKSNLEIAYKIISKASPQTEATILKHTNVILPIDAPGVVSYSLQTLPGHSFINTFERDFVDLIDDLAHENGHHQLNISLQLFDLIHEDDEKIYYSPWRRSLRPIRGMYHGFLTFNHALVLFGDLSKKILDGSINNLTDYTFSDDEISKIQLRFLEEFLLLRACYPSLDHAYKANKMTEMGFDLYMKTREEVDNSQPLFDEVLKSCNIKIKDSISELDEFLTQKLAEYKLQD